MVVQPVNLMLVLPIMLFASECHPGDASKSSRVEQPLNVTGITPLPPEKFSVRVHDLSDDVDFCSGDQDLRDYFINVSLTAPKVAP